MCVKVNRTLTLEWLEALKQDWKHTLLCICGGNCVTLFHMKRSADCIINSHGPLMSPPPGLYKTVLRKENRKIHDQSCPGRSSKDRSPLCKSSADRPQFSIKVFRVPGKEHRLPSSRVRLGLLLTNCMPSGNFTSPSLGFLICEMGMTKNLPLWGGSEGLNGLGPALACREWSSPLWLSQAKWPTRSQDWDLGWSYGSHFPPKRLILKVQQLPMGTEHHPLASSEATQGPHSNAYLKPFPSTTRPPPQSHTLNPSIGGSHRLDSDSRAPIFSSVALDRGLHPSTHHFTLP